MWGILEILEIIEKPVKSRNAGKSRKKGDIHDSIITHDGLDKTRLKSALFAARAFWEISRIPRNPVNPVKLDLSPIWVKDARFIEAALGS